MTLNPAHAIFDSNVFVQLGALLDPIPPPADLPVLDMSIGEPQQPPAKLLIDSVLRYNEQWQFYPKATGSPHFTGAVETYIARRWPEAAGLADQSQIIPVPGTRDLYIYWAILSMVARQMQLPLLQTHFIMLGGRVLWPVVVKSFI